MTIFKKLVGMFSIFVLFLLVTTEFIIIEPKIVSNFENQGKSLLEYYSQTIRNDFLSGYREGLNVSAELLVAAGQCNTIRIFNSQDQVIASYPAEEFSTKKILQEEYNTKTSNNSKLVSVSKTNTHIIFSKSIGFDDTLSHKLGVIELGILRENLNATILISRLTILGIGLFFIFIFFIIARKFMISYISAPLLSLSEYLRKFEHGVRDTLALNPNLNQFEEFNMLYVNSKKLVDRITIAEEMIERKGAVDAIGELIQDFSHGVRTPITVIKNTALDIIVNSERLLEEKEISRDAKRQFKKNILSQKEAIIDESNKVEGFVSHILDSTQPIMIRTSPTALFNLAEKIIEIYRSCEFKKKIIFLNQIDPNLPHLQLDKAYFEEVFDNLFSNAIYAIENNDSINEGYIRIYSSTEGVNGSSKVKICVEDNGCGIQETDLKRIFKPHFTTKKHKGNGRGLFIVQRILDKHNASITVESCVSKGTKMSMHVPYGEIHV